MKRGLALLAWAVCAASHGAALASRHATLCVDGAGFITSLTARATGTEYSPPGHPSPLLSLHVRGQPNEHLLPPAAARFGDGEVALTYANGAIATVKLEAKDAYFRLQLVALAPRGDVDNVVWGLLNTTISGRIGDLIGVVRSDDWAIGLLGLDDNTIAGPVADGDCYQMGYYVHSPDPVRQPLPPPLREGQRFAVGGDGVSDTAFFSRPEEYFQFVCGNGAWLEPGFGSSIAYHARDRRQPYVHHWSLLPGFQRSRPRHMVSDPVPGVDFIGSAVALYACPDDQGLATIEAIIRAEGLPYITDRDGRWVRDPAAWRPTVYWSGPVDKAIEYTKALGLKDISRDTGEFYATGRPGWEGRVGFADGKTLSYREFAERAHAAGLTHGGLHTLCAFLQGAVSRDVTPAPSEHLQTVCRTKLARDLSATDTVAVVTDPSFLAEMGTWTWGDDSNYLRIGGEMLHYAGISAQAPWTLTGVRRGHASKAEPHRAGDGVVKLMQNCYNGFVPDLALLLDYADYYADLMVRNGMDTINFDGFESTVYQNQGYYAVRRFCRRLFESYHRQTGGKWPRVTGSNVFPGSWEFLNTCDIGGGDHLFNARTGRRGIEGKDIGNGWSNSYYPGTFGIQGWHSDWSLYDAENLEAKAVGWDATYALSISQESIDRTGERDAIFAAFRAWQSARALGIFGKEAKRRLRDPDWKFHLEQTGPATFRLRAIQEIRFAGAGVITNAHGAQPLQCAVRLLTPAEGCRIRLPDGQVLEGARALEPGQFIICKGDTAYVADAFRRKIADLPLARSAILPAGASPIAVDFPQPGAGFELTVWISAPAEKIGR